ncbi:MAG TPA: hypothetical protein VGM90_04615 [Kofleriaceae bacterium]
MKLRNGGLVALLLASACGGDDKTADCHLGDTESAVLVQDRKIIGPAAPYTPSDLASHEEELRTSIAARRAAAWQIVEKVLAPVPLADPSLAAAFGGQPTIPAWHTWYGHDDYERIFKYLYRGLGAAGRATRSAIDPAAGFAWNPTALDEIPEWPEQRYMDYLATIDTQDEANGVGGNSRVGYSPGAMAHLLTSYEKLHQCRLNPAPDAFDTSPMKAAQAVEQAMPASVAKCDFVQLGVVQAGAGKVTAVMKGDGDADLYVKRGGPPTALDYDCKSAGGSSAETCAVDGDGSVYIAAFGAADASAITVDVSYMTSDVVDPACLDGEMTRDSVLVKADWVRQLDQSDLLPVFITSGERMTSRFDSESAWTPDGNATPGSADIYTVTLPSTGAKFRMPALHIMSKELDHWIWITLWYSAFPDDDFGADRPADITGPWRNYKMCVTTGYNEGDPDPRGGFAGSLGDALASVYRGPGAPTWCSNPYLEEGQHNARTNCIGCHQQGGTDLTPEAILSDQPEYGVTRTRNNFFTDYLWAIKGGGGEDLSSLVQAEIDYWDATDP